MAKVAINERTRAPVTWQVVEGPRRNPAERDAPEDGVRDDRPECAGAAPGRDRRRRRARIFVQTSKRPENISENVALRGKGA